MLKIVRNRKVTLQMISVIIPIYNVELYLRQCIESVCNQTFKDLEIILVDDGSTDSSGKICDEFAGRDKRIVVIHKQNGGLVSARQAGIQAASGAFVGWVDGDDWIESYYFEQMNLAQKESGSEIITSGIFTDMGTSSQVILDNIPSGIYSSEALLPKLLCSGEFFEYGLQPTLVTKLIRREILYKTEMMVDCRICVGEDAATFYPTVLKAKKITITNICGYHYRQHPKSLTHTGRTNEQECLQLLIDHLSNVFISQKREEVMLPQLNQYKKYLYAMRCISYFDQGILSPYGGIPYGCRIVIYGAGILGQQIYHYLFDYDYAKILLWVDRNAEYYQEIGMNISLPEQITQLEDQFDYILIANTRQAIADEIRHYLLKMNIPAAKIRWFSEKFILG